MTASFHKFGEYFPGTGDVKDKGFDVGENYAINCPLHDGMDDESFKAVFQPIIGKIMEKFQPVYSRACRLCPIHERLRRTIACVGRRWLYLEKCPKMLDL